MDILNKLKNEIIISTQASKGEPLYNETAMRALIQSVINGGAKVLRLAGTRDIKYVKENFKDIIVIGITKPEIIPKNYLELVYITPTIQDAKDLIDAGADIIAFDATNRKKDCDLKEMIDFIKSHKKLAMADVSTYLEAKKAVEFKADIVSTTLSGYTLETQDMPDSPDFELTKKMANNLDCFVIQEGKIWEVEDMKKAFKSGADAVVIGSAVTRPQLIVKRFMEKNR